MRTRRYELWLNSGQRFQGLSEQDLLVMVAAGLAAAGDQVRPMEPNAAWSPIGQWARGKPLPQIRRGCPPEAAPTRVRRRRYAQLEEYELELTPMIDVVFQLLIFFMLAGYFATGPVAELATAQSGQGISTEEKLVIDVLQENGGYVVYFPSVGDKVRLDEAKRRLKEELNRGGFTEVIVRADRRLPVSVVRDLLQTAKEAGATASYLGVETE